eukprot:9504432-Ditylum_brightwellii.AAC.1
MREVGQHKNKGSREVKKGSQHKSFMLDLVQKTLQWYGTWGSWLTMTTNLPLKTSQHQKQHKQQHQHQLLMMGGTGDGRV